MSLARLLRLPGEPRGSALQAGELAGRAEHALRLGGETTNGDGFGVGWYGTRDTPGLFHSTSPAWNGRNLHELAAHTAAARVSVHLRASTGSAIQDTSGHPFRRGRWLWMHNGFLTGFPLVKRDVLLAVDPELFPRIEGSTDSEVFFCLALTFGLEQDPPAAVAKAVGLIEETGRRHGIRFPIQMSVATTDGETTWAFRCSSEGQSRSLFHSTDVDVLKQQYPDHPVLHQLAAETRLTVSEPLGSLHGAGREVPESSCLVVRGGREELLPFNPQDYHAVA